MREYVDLTAMAAALEISVEQLKIEMHLNIVSESAQSIVRTRVETPHATIGGRPYMFWHAASPYLVKKVD